ncbi:MAG: hypothetical protein AAF229_13465 [Pseudomonadota bacterium]
MSVAAASTLVSVIGIYLAIGLITAIAFAAGLAKRIDPDAGEMTWGARLMIIPGVMGLWPLMLKKLFTQTEPPVS